MSQQRKRTVPPAERLCSAEEIGQHFGVQRQTVLEWYHAGAIPARVAVGRTYRFDLAEVTQALADEAATRQAKRGIQRKALIF